MKPVKVIFLAITKYISATSVSAAILYACAKVRFKIVLEERRKLVYMHLMYACNTDAQMSKVHSYDIFACCYVATIQRAIP